MRNPHDPAVEATPWQDDEAGYTYSTIRLRVKDGVIQLKLDFSPQINPQKLTFDQAAAAVGVQAISEFIRTGVMPEPPKDRDAQTN